MHAFSFLPHHDLRVLPLCATRPTAQSHRLQRQAAAIRFRSASALLSHRSIKTPASCASDSAQCDILARQHARFSHLCLILHSRLDCTQPQLVRGTRRLDREAAGSLTERATLYWLRRSVSDNNLPVIQVRRILYRSSACAIASLFAAKVKLAPPQQQLPDIQAETNQLQSLREQLETVRWQIGSMTCFGMARSAARKEYAGRLQAAYSKALERARIEITKMVDGSL